MTRTKRWLLEAVGAVAVCCMVLSCVVVSEQSLFAIVDTTAPADPPCANNPTCVVTGEGTDQVCGNKNGGTSGGGNCDPAQGQESCVCVFNGVNLCVCSK